MNAPMVMPPVSSPEVVKLLEDVLARARAGEVHSIGIVVAPSFTAACGPDLAGVYIACDLLKGRIAQARADPSPIMRVRN
jgi:hypothetical protein